MAGKNHHHIWNFIQKGFATEEHGDHHIWLFSKDSPPRRTVTRKFGSEKLFYGDEGSQADLNITEFENKSQELIRFVRKSSHGIKLDSSSVAPIVSHFEVRGKFIRAEASELVTKLLGRMKELFSDKRKLDIILAANFRKNPIKAEMNLLDAGVPPDRIDLAMQYLDVVFEDVLSGYTEKIAALNGEAFDDIINSMADTIVRAHNKSLELPFEEMERSKIHSQREYFVWKSIEDNLILPDTSVAFLVGNGSKPFTSKEDTVNGLFIPVSSNSAIVGCEKTLEFSPNAARRVLASCSYRCFISHENVQKNLGLVSRIGRNARLIKAQDMDEMLAFKNFTSLSL